MKKFYFSCLILILFFGNVFLEEELHPDWVLKIRGDENLARRIAEENNFHFIGKVGNLDQTYHFKEKENSNKRTKRNVISKSKVLMDNDHVFWVEHQKEVKRMKRNVMIDDEQEKDDLNVKTMFNDPLWKDQWYLYDNRESRKEIKQDLHVIPVWRMNITGRGVTVSILDDGIEYTHPDLKDNYDPKSSYDVNDNDDDPMPNLNPGTSNEHGTRCASEISMAANNRICGVGIAYNAKIGGIRMLDGIVNDLIEAKALGFNNQHIDIYSASWGPNDNGKAMEKPGILAAEALLVGATKGRKGKGNLYVWAAGNGGYFNDTCSCDGYVSSIYTININSISPSSSKTAYSESCSSVIASTFSSSSKYTSKLIVADVLGKCTNKHSGTSASAPYAAGIFALALEANPDLTWRDIKHLLTWTSQVSPLSHIKGWKMNNAGFWISHTFGFGQIDAKNFVSKAKSWVTVPSMKSCKLKESKKYLISNNVSQKIVFDGSECYPKVKFIEHILIEMTFQYSKRGSLQIMLTSSTGTTTTLLTERNLDDCKALMVNWPFVTVHSWGEDPRGLWSIFIKDDNNDNKERNGFVQNVSISFIGTRTIPHHIKVSPNHKRKYDMNYNHVKNDKRNYHSSKP